LKKIIQYTLSFALAIALVWFLFKNQNVGDIIQEIKSANYWFILLTYITGMISHLARAYRWNILFQPLGYNPGSLKTMLAVMFGYFMNLVLPRAGEISRCGLLKRTDNIPLEESIGTVVAERAFDLLTMLTIILLAFAFNFDLFQRIFVETGAGINLKPSTIWILVLIVLASLLLGIIILVLRKKLMRFVVFEKISIFLSKVWQGMMTVKKIKQKKMFFISTFVIWLMYYLTSYIGFFAIPATSGLGLDVGLTILVVSSLAMILPVQGGIGAYHLFVSTALVFYGLSKEQGLVYATIMHASQFLLLFAGGAISFFIATWLANKSK
jgi:hypothetical protein